MKEEAFFQEGFFQGMKRVKMAQRKVNVLIKRKRKKKKKKKKMLMKREKQRTEARGKRRRKQVVEALQSFE